MLCVVFHEIKKSALGAALRRANLNFVSSALRECFFEQGTFLEIFGDVNHFGQILSIEIKLLQEGRHKLLRIKFLKVFPVKFAAVHHAPAAQVKKIRGHQRRLGVIGENVGIIALRRRDPLALLDVFERAQQVAISRGLLEQFFLRGGGHAFFEAVHQIVAASFEKHARITRGFGVALVGSEPGNARAKTALDVILQAGTRMMACEVDRA